MLKLENGQLAILALKCFQGNDENFLATKMLMKHGLGLESLKYKASIPFSELLWHVPTSASLN